MKKIFVSGCYDILHAGHIQFLKDARKLGDHLTVCFASDKVYKMCRGRESSIPESNKKVILESLSFVDKVVMSSDEHLIFDFASHIKKERPDILVSTEDDVYQKEKREFCKKCGIDFILLSKRNFNEVKTSTTKILAGIKNKVQVPLRVDFAGGWLDVPKFSKKGTYIVNCSISPLVSLDDWSYEKGAGLGGSAAKAILDIKNGVEKELDLGVGWQDPAVIEETGLCVWRSGKTPVLEAKYNPDWLSGKMLIHWTGLSHNTPNVVNKSRDFKIIAEAGKKAFLAVQEKNIRKLAEAISLSYKVQLKEGMDNLLEIKGSISKKYLGGGYGGYALYLFKNEKDRNLALKIKGTRKIEPYLRETK